MCPHGGHPARQRSAFGSFPGAWACVAALGALRLAASPIHESAPLFTRIAEPAVVPAEVSSNGMFVRVMINGQGPFRMQVDTGSSNSVISPEVAAAVEARGIDREDDDVEAVNGLGNVVLMPRVLLDSITIGGVQLEGVVAGVVPLELQSRIDSRAVDGLLGYTVFSDLFFALDFPGQDLVLSSEWPRNLPPVRATLAIVEHTQVPFVTVRLQGRDFEMMIDTGANDRIHLPPSAAATLSWKAEPRPGFLLAVVGDIAREQIGRLTGTLELGGLRQMEPVAAVSDGTPSIGSALLRPLCVVFHEAEDKLWLCSADDGPLPSPPVRSVGLSLYADTGGWRVAGIIPNSPAEEAGIKPGDLVTQIERQPARNWTREQIDTWIDTHAALSLALSAGTGERDVGLRVWQLVP